VLRPIAWKPPQAPIVANATAEPNGDPARIVELLLAQVTAPVAGWRRAVAGEGRCDTLVELGPGKVLAGLVRRIDKGCAPSPSRTTEPAGRARRGVQVKYAIVLALALTPATHSSASTRSCSTTPARRTRLLLRLECLAKTCQFKSFGDCEGEGVGRRPAAVPLRQKSATAIAPCSAPAQGLQAGRVLQGGRLPEGASGMSQCYDNATAPGRDLLLRQCVTAPRRSLPDRSRLWDGYRCINGVCQ